MPRSLCSPWTRHRPCFTTPRRTRRDMPIRVVEFKRNIGLWFPHEQYQSAWIIISNRVGKTRRKCGPKGNIGNRETNLQWNFQKGHKRKGFLPKKTWSWKHWCDVDDNDDTDFTPFSRERLRRVLRKKTAVILHLHIFTSADLDLHTFTSADLHLHTLIPADLDLHTFTPADLDLHTFTSADLHLHTFTPADLHLHTFTSADLHLHTLTSADLHLHTPWHLQI